jgi:hypothetical protein
MAQWCAAAGEGQKQDVNLNAHWHTLTHIFTFSNGQCACHLDSFPLVVHSHAQLSHLQITAWHSCHNLGCPLNLGPLSVISCCCTHVHAHPCHCLFPTDHYPVLASTASTILAALDKNKALTFVPTHSPLHPLLDRHTLSALSLPQASSFGQETAAEETIASLS